MDIEKLKAEFEQSECFKRLEHVAQYTFFEFGAYIKRTDVPADIEKKCGKLITALLFSWSAWKEAKAQAVPAKLVLELEKGRFKEYEFKALLRQSLRASKVTRSKLNWVHVISMLGTGSTVAHRICEALGVNPDGTEFKAQEQAND